MARCGEAISASWCCRCRRPGAPRALWSRPCRRGARRQQAGLLPGDILLRLGDESVAVLFFEQVPDLYRRAAELPIGRSVELAVERAGAPLTLRATVTELEPARGEEREMRRLGISAQEITGPMVLARELRAHDGVLVTGIRPGQPAAGARPQIAPGDVLVALDGEPVSSLGDLDRALASAPGPELLLELWRGDERLLSIARLPAGRNGRSGGELPKAWLGVRTQVVTAELAEALKLTGTAGFRITEVYPWTEAARAGLAVGDLVVAIDGVPLEASRPQDAEELRRTVEERPIGALASFGLLRGGGPVDIDVRLEAQPAGADQARRSRQEEFEFAVRELLFLDRIEENWELDEQGVVVTDVVSGGWAHMAGLRTKDLIVRVDSTPVTDVASFEAALARTLADRPAVVALFLRRGARTHFVFLEPEWAELDPERSR